ncbi:MAG: phosphate uptake regulator PhoU [Sulfolobales archaeon]|nr:phosphate uptake regulator PhoU [Sulfolobales archaeon]MCX8186169.1 phosphate uptake regulator PhoU [Sulfolobales archaeon]MDW7969464.1 phosphate uptake regulator PhoU [Sulfolobales archaeon]
MDEIKYEVRTIQKVGSSLAVYVPKEWCEVNNITKGSKVTLRYTNNFLCIDLDETGKVRGKTIDFDITSIPENELRYLITSFYVVGYERVKLISHKKISLPLRRFVLSVLKYTPKYSVIEEGENYMIIGEIGGVEDILEALKREFNSVTTVFKYTIEALESAPKSLIDYYESINELDDEVDRAQVEVERAAYRLIDKPLVGVDKIKYIISASVISTLLERLSDHFVLLIKEVSNGFSNVEKLSEYLHEFSKDYRLLFEVIDKITTKGYDEINIPAILSPLIYINERKRNVRENITKALYEKGHELVTYHVIRIYGIIADISEVLVNLLMSLKPIR